MREDMFKVIVTRPRHGRSWATKSKLRYDKCEERSHVTGHRLVSEKTGLTKSLNENLAPLKRYLHKQVGRKWDDVFSEICRHLDTGSTVKMHVRLHIDDFIIRKVGKNTNGQLISRMGYGGEELIINCWPELYVDPLDGRIKETKKLCKKSGVTYIRKRTPHWQKYLSGPTPIKQQSSNIWYIQLVGIWYKIKLCSIPTHTNGQVLSPDELYEQIISKKWNEHKCWRIIQKNQLSKKALKLHGLSNSATNKVEGNYG